MRHFFFTTLFLLFSVSAFAAGTGWSQTGKIVEVYNFGWTVMVKIEGTPVDYSAGGACSDTSYYAVNSSVQNYDQLVSQILMAHASGMTTQMWITANECAGQNNNKQKISTIKTIRQ